MAEETDLSRTEPASPRRLQQARSAGDVPRSAELTAWLVLLSALGMLGWMAPRLLGALETLTETAFRHAAEPLSPVFLEAAQTALWAVLPVLAVIFVAALLAPILLSGWVYAPQLTQADLTRANPLKPFARLFSADSWVDGTLALAKLALAVVVVGWALGGPALQSLAGSETKLALNATAAWVGRGVLILAAALALVAALDAGWRWWRYLRHHAMTWQEVLAEAREAEVHPEVRARLRGRQQQAGQGRAQSKAIPLPNPPPVGEGTNVMPKPINEVIG
jgi:flagellar biosynthetic protein FlhB